MKPCSTSCFFLLMILITSCNTSVSFNSETEDTDNNPSKNTTEDAGPSSPVSGGEWIKVPPNAGGMGLDEFYVMKYEAKAVLDDESAVDPTGTGAGTATHKPISTQNYQPWRYIDAYDATAECESLGSNYFLISNDEWIAIARDIENVDSNWTGGSVGSGCLFRGNSGENGTAPGACGYSASTTPDSGSGRDSRAIHTLSNGQEIFDFSGNAIEWVDWDRDALGFQSGPTTCSSGQIPTISCAALVDADFNTSNGTYAQLDGAGYFYGGSGGGAKRGGDWGFSSFAGIFSIYLSSPSTHSTGSTTGFRCVWRQ